MKISSLARRDAGAGGALRVGWVIGEGADSVGAGVHLGRFTRRFSMNPYTPYDLIASSERALESWKQLPFEEKLAFFKEIGLLDENGNIHPDSDWTAERYAREFGPRTTAPASAVEIKPASSGG